MNRRAALRSRLPVALFALLGVGCATTPAAPPAPTFDDRMRHVTSPPPFDGIHWGILVMDAATGEALYEHNAHRRFAPASNMKIAVSAAALGLLGPDYRWETAFYAADEPANGLLFGDLHLAGSGDPSLGAPWHDPPERAVEALADSLRAAGVREVQGSLILDVAAWDSTTVPSAWLVGNLPGRSAATGGAFSIRTGELEVRVTAGSQAGDPARVDWSPRGRGEFVEAWVTTVAPDGDTDLRSGFFPESRRWLIEGEIRPGETRTLTLAQRDPVRLALDVLSRTLEERGMSFRGEPVIHWERERPVFGRACMSGELPTCPAARRIAALQSPPLSEIVREILEPSQNWITEQLVRTVGAELGEEGSWEEGFELIRRYLVEAAGVSPWDLHFRDGSGLSGYNLLTPRAIVGILDHAARQPWGPAFRAAMAEPGKEDTTLSGRLEGMEGRVFAKTGTISHANALSGYLIADDGRELLFSILTNTTNLPATRVRPAMDELVREIAREFVRIE